MLAHLTLTSNVNAMSGNQKKRYWNRRRNDLAACNQRLKYPSAKHARMLLLDGEVGGVFRTTQLTTIWDPYGSQVGTHNDMGSATWFHMGPIWAGRFK